MRFSRAAQLGLFSLIGVHAPRRRKGIAAPIVLAAMLGACQNPPGDSDHMRTDTNGELAVAAELPAQRRLEVGTGSTQAAPETLQTAELMVEGTSCASCAVTIRRHLHQLQGIGEIREGSTKQHLLVEFNPKLVTAEQLIKAVSDAGYEAEVLVHSVGATAVIKHGG